MNMDNKLAAPAIVREMEQVTLPPVTRLFMNTIASVFAGIPTAPVKAALRYTFINKLPVFKDKA